MGLGAGSRPVTPPAAGPHSCPPPHALWSHLAFSARSVGCRRASSTTSSRSLGSGVGRVRALGGGWAASRPRALPAAPPRSTAHHAACRASTSQSGGAAPPRAALESSTHAFWRRPRHPRGVGDGCWVLSRAGRGARPCPQKPAQPFPRTPPNQRTHTLTASSQADWHAASVAGSRAAARAASRAAATRPSAARAPRRFKSATAAAARTRATSTEGQAMARRGRGVGRLAAGVCVWGAS